PSISDGRLSYQFSSDGYIRRSVYAYRLSGRMLFLYYAVERKVVSKGLRSREMAAAGNFGGSVPERKRNTVLSQPL
ncbi:hypothetical protein, partial [Escherichia coli]